MYGVALENVSKSYEPGKPVLTNIDLNIESGELFFLLGPSGCGKSTLLRSIAGFLTLDSGQIRFGDRDVTALPPEQRMAAMVFQNYALWPHMTVRENVEFGLEVRKVPAAERRQQAMDALTTVGLADYAERRIPTLSGGQQQRVALARAVVVRPEVLLLDEPLSNLDASLRVAMRGEIRRICKDAKLTTIYVTHEQKEALSIADRMAVLDSGVIKQVGSPREVYQQPNSRFVAEFIGESNFLAASVTGQDGETWILDTPLGQLRSTAGPDTLKVGDEVELSIRPECIQLAADGGDNSFPIVLDEFVYLGETGQWRVRHQDTVLKVFELKPRERPAGDQLSGAVAASDIVILPKP